MTQSENNTIPDPPEIIEDKSEDVTEPEAQEDGSEIQLDADELIKTLAAFQKKIKEQEDSILRTRAEYDNYRKRSMREKESAYTDSKVMTISELLPAIDNFERALENTSGTFEDYKKGVEMIYEQIIGIINSMGITAFGEKGDEFDPNIHSAVTHIEDEKLGNNVIADVYQKGFRLDDKILRHAMVAVAN